MKQAKMLQFRPMLAETCSDPSQLEYPVLVSPKLDGIRCVIHHNAVLSRSLKPIPNRFVRSELHGLPPLDGELIVGDPTNPRTWNETTSAIMSHDGEPDFTFYVFDAIIPGKPFQERLKFAASQYGAHARIRLVEHTRCDSIGELLHLENEFVNQGYEGLMVRSMGGPYKYGRSTEKEGFLLKIKRFEDLEARVIGIQERQHHIGEAKVNALGLAERDHRNSSFVGMNELGALECQIDGSSVQFSVGSGFTAQQRIDFWNGWLCIGDRGTRSVPNAAIGKLAKIKCQGFTPDGKPRFPVFIGFRDPLDLS